MDPDIQLQIEVDVLGLENIKRLKQEMSNLLTVQGKLNAANGNNITKWEQLRDALDQIEQKYDAVFRAGFRLQNLGADLTRMGKAMTGMLSSATDQWGDFEFAMNRAAGALEIFDDQSAIYGHLKDAIYAAAQEARIFPAEDIARATYYWGSTTGQVVKTQKDLKILMDGLVPIMKAAALTETDYETAIKGVYSILIQYRLGLGSARDVTEKLMLITQKTAAEFPDLVNSFKMMGPVAASLGISFDEVVTYLGLLADAGLRGTLTGRALRQTFIKLVDPTKRAKEALNAVFEENEDLGKSFDELLFPNGEFVGFTKYINILATAMEDMNMQQKNQLLGIITTQNELGPLTALINEQIEARKGNKNAIDQEKLSLADAHTQFESMFGLLKNSWQGLVGLWSNSVIPIIHLIGAEVARMLTPALEFFANLAQAAYRWLVQHKEVTEWIVKLTALAAAALLLGGVFFSVLGTLFVFASGVGLAIESLIAVGRVLGGGIAKFGALGFAISLVTAIIVTDFGGIRGAIGSVVSAIGALIRLVGHAFAQAGRTIGFFVDIVINAIGFVDEFFKALGNINFSATKRQLGVVNTLLEAFGWIVEAVGGTLLGVGITILAVTKAIALAKAAVLGLKTAWVLMLTLGPAIRLFMIMIGGFQALATVTGVLTAAVHGLGWALKLVFLSNPIGAAIALAILAIGGLVLAVKHAGDVVNNFAMDFGHMGSELNRVADETGRSYQSIKDSVKSAMAEHDMSFDEAVAHVENYNDVSDYATRHTAELTAAAQENKIGMSDLGAQLGMTAEEMEAAGIATPELAAALGGVGTEVEGVTQALEKANWADTVVGQLAIAAQQGRTEARRIPSEIAAGILEGRNDVVNAAKGVGDAVTYELMNEARVGEIRTEMGKAQTAITEAINAGTPGAVAAANAEYIALELELAGYLLTIDPLSKEAAGILEKYIHSSDPATQAAAEALYGALEDRALVAQYNIEQYAHDLGIAPENAIKLFKAGTILQATLMASGIERPVEGLVTDLQHHGEDAVSGLSTAITENAYLASTASGEVKKKAEENLILLRDIASQYGYDTSEAYAEGVRRGAYQAWLAGKEVANHAKAAFEASSPPVVTSPLHKIDVWGYRTVLAWADGIRKAGSYAFRMAREVVAGVKDPFTSGMESAVAFKPVSGSGFSASFDVTDHKVVDLNVNVTSSDGSVSDENAASIADAIQSGLMLDRLEHLVRVS